MSSRWLPWTIAVLVGAAAALSLVWAFSLKAASEAELEKAQAALLEVDALEKSKAVVVEQLETQTKLRERLEREELTPLREELEQLEASLADALEAGGIDVDSSGDATLTEVATWGTDFELGDEALRWICGEPLPVAGGLPTEPSGPGPSEGGGSPRFGFDVGSVRGVTKGGHLFAVVTATGYVQNGAGERLELGTKTITSEDGVEIAAFLPPLPPVRRSWGAGPALGLLSGGGALGATVELPEAHLLRGRVVLRPSFTLIGGSEDFAAIVASTVSFPRR
jgi:hypothetical protein